MLLYHSVAQDNALSQSKNIHQNAQLAYKHLLKYQTLSDMDRQTVYGGIVSTIDTNTYYNDVTEIPDAAWVFVHFYENNHSFKGNKYEDTIKIESQKTSLADHVHAVFSEKAYLI